MDKREFLGQLREGLSGLPPKDIEERLTFYSEMIEDGMEEGLSEAEAVAAVGSVQEIVAQVLADTPPVKAVKAESKRRLKTWEIVLLALGSPIWLSLGIAVFAVILSLYISLWAVVIALWAVFGALVGCAVGGVASGVGFVYSGNTLPGIAMLGAALVCAGFAIFMFLGCKAATKGAFLLAKKMVLGVKKCFRKKEEV